MKIRYDATMRPPRQVAPGLVMPLPGVAICEGVDLEGALYDVAISLDMTPEGVRPTSVTVTAQAGSPPVTGTTLRAVRVWDLARQGITAAVARGGESGSVVGGALADEDVRRVRQQGPTEESLGWVAHFYNLAGVLGLPPAKHVEDNLGLPRTTATKWIKRARDKGLLGEPQTGAPTEHSTRGMPLEEMRELLNKWNPDSPMGQA